MDHLLGFLEHLNSINLGYLLQSDAEAVIVLVRTTTGIHEVSFFADGAIEIQTFASEGTARKRSRWTDLPGRLQGVGDRFTLSPCGGEGFLCV